MGLLNDVLSTRQTPIPFALPAIAAFIAETISLTIAVVEPVHWYEQPVMAQASWSP